MVVAGPLVALVLAPKATADRRTRWSTPSLSFVRFVVVASLGEALARLGGERIDAVLVDGAHSPDGGIELVKRLAPLVTDRPVILLTPRATVEEFANVAAAALESEVRLVADEGPAEVVKALRAVVADCRKRERRRERERLDPVTGLLVRSAFIADLATQLQADPLALGALAVIDLDGLKGLNALLGIADADRILLGVADRLAGVAHPDDRLGAIGGGRFAIWSAAPDGIEAITARLRRFLGAVARPFRCGEHKLSLSAAAGVACHPADASCAETLLARAEAAMYRAKVLGPQSYCLHQPSLVGAAPSVLRRRASVRRDLTNDSLELVFEPQMDLRTDRPRAARLHLRTRDDGTLLSLAADAFDDLALPVIRWTLETAGNQMAEWLGNDVPLVPLVVELPLRLLHRNDVVDMIHRRLQSVGCHPAWFEAAVRPDVVPGGAHTAAHLQALRDLGLRVTLTGFGGSAGSLAALRYLPADAVELAADLVARQREHATDGILARSVVKLAHDLGLEVGAAGVDRPVLGRDVRDIGCDWACGAWVGTTATARGFSEWLSGNAVVEDQTAAAS